MSPIIPRWCEAKLFANAGAKQGYRRSQEPDWAEVDGALKRKHVTLSIVWEEYMAREPDGYRYSRFCELYRGWQGVTMRRSHAAGEKRFIDYAGDGVPIVVDRLTGEIRNAAHRFHGGSLLSCQLTSALPRWRISRSFSHTCSP
jgi:transposase